MDANLGNTTQVRFSSTTVSQTEGNERHAGPNLSCCKTKKNTKKEKKKRRKVEGGERLSIHKWWWW
jgi:hypothetical protein